MTDGELPEGLGCCQQKNWRTVKYKINTEESKELLSHSQEKNCSFQSRVVDSDQEPKRRNTLIILFKPHRGTVMLWRGEVPAWSDNWLMWRGIMEKQISPKMGEITSSMTDCLCLWCCFAQSCFIIDMMWFEPLKLVCSWISWLQQHLVLPVAGAVVSQTPFNVLLPLFSSLLSHSLGLFAGLLLFVS